MQKTRHKPSRRLWGRSAVTTTAAITLTMTCAAIPAVYADSSVSVSSTSTISKTSTAMAQGMAPNGSRSQQSNISQADVVAIVHTLFGSLVGRLGSPSVSLQRNAMETNQPAYQVDWNTMAFSHDSGPHLGQNYAHATVDAETGQVIQFQNTPSAWQEEAPISLPDAQTIASGWVKELAPRQADGVVLQDSKHLSNGFEFLFVRKVNGILAPFDSMSVQLQNDGTLQYYSFSWHKATFPAPESTKVSLTEAQTSYDQHLKLKLQYQQTYGARGPGPMKLVYQPVSDAQSTMTTFIRPLPMIDAVTGKEMALDGKDVSPVSKEKQDTPIDPNGPTKLPTPFAKPLTKDEATALVQKQLGLDGPDWQLQNAQQISHAGNRLLNHEMWNLSFTNTKTHAGMSAEVDSTDGLIVDYNAYNQAFHPGASQGNGQSLSSDQLQTKANEAVAKLFPNLTGAIAPAHMNFYGEPPNQTPFFYDFLINGIPVQGLQVMLNANTGALQNLFLQTDPSMNFPSPSKAVSMETARSEFKKADPLVLQYMLPEQQPTSTHGPFQLTYGNTAKLVYRTAPLAEGFGTLNAVTNTWQYPPMMGQPGQQNGSTPSAKATPAEKAIATLEQHGIMNGEGSGTSGKVDASAVMTRARFVAWLSRAYGMNISSDPAPQFTDVQPTSPYASDLSTALMQGWIHNQDALDPGAALTRAQAAQWLVDWMGWNGPASHAGFFKAGFSDAKSVPSAELGAAVMMSQTGVLPLEHGKFMANQKLTVGQAAEALVQAVHVYLSSDN